MFIYHYLRQDVRNDDAYFFYFIACCRNSFAHDTSSVKFYRTLDNKNLFSAILHALLFKTSCSVFALSQTALFLADTWYHSCSVVEIYSYLDTLNVMQWGQFLDHDLAHTPLFRLSNPNATGES